MPSAFSQLFVARQKVLDKAFGELLEIRHYLKGEFSTGVLDPAHPPYQVVGILDTPEQVVVNPKGLSQIMMTAPTASFGYEVFDPVKPLPVMTSHIVAVTRPGAPAFTLTAPPKDDGVSRWVCLLQPVQ